MTRIDKYWKRSAAGLLAALMLMAGGRGMNFESFAMTSKTPFMEEAALQSPGTLVINDGQAAVQASQDILTPVQIGTDAGIPSWFPALLCLLCVAGEILFVRKFRYRPLLMVLISAIMTLVFCNLAALF